MPYNVDDDGEVILMDDDRFDTWDDNNHCLVTDHVDWKDIQRVDFFKTYVKLCTYWRSYYVFYDDNKEHSDMIHQIVALNFLKNKEEKEEEVEEEEIPEEIPETIPEEEENEE